MIKERMEQRGQGGFTLIELLVVVAILAILVGVAVVGVGAMRKNARSGACKSDLDTIETAALAFNTTNEGQTTDVTGLSNAGLLKKIGAAGSFVINWTGDTPTVTYNSVAASKYGTGVSANCTPT